MPAKPLAPLRRFSGGRTRKLPPPGLPSGFLSSASRKHLKASTVLVCSLALGLLASTPLLAITPDFGKTVEGTAEYYEAGFGGFGVAMAGGALGVLLLVSGAVEFRKTGFWNRRFGVAAPQGVVVGPIVPPRPARPAPSSLLAPGVVAKGEKIPEPGESVVRHEISHMIRTIDEVALRANVLALDAAVEAARPGRDGMGFAVVADEVRSLAQGTAKAARETADTYEECLRRRDSAVQIYASVGQRLSLMVEQARQVHDFVAQIAMACPEASPGLGLVTEQADDQSTGGTKRLKSQAEALHRCVQDLQALV